MKGRIAKAVRNTVIVVVVLLVLSVGGGAAYTYFLGPDISQSAAVAPPPPPSEPVIKPSQPAPNAKVGASVQSITSPVPQNSNTSITVRSLRGATCKISVVYNNVASTDSGLRPKIADEFGIVSWTWTVGATVPAGKWPVKVDCTYNGRSAVVQADLQVTAN